MSHGRPRLRSRGRGTLYIVATPIGNLEDIASGRSGSCARSDLIACEDTRQTVKLLNRHGIQPS